MARSPITVRTLTSPRSGLNGVYAAYYDTADATNDHEFTHPGGVVVLNILNFSGATMNVVVPAVASLGTRQAAEDYTATILDGDHLWLPIGYNDGYVNSSGKVDVDIDQDTSSWLGVLKLVKS